MNVLARKDKPPLINKNKFKSSMAFNISFWTPGIYKAAWFLLNKIS